MSGHSSPPNNSLIDNSINPTASATQPTTNSQTTENGPTTNTKEQVERANSLPTLTFDASTPQYLFNITYATLPINVLEYAVCNLILFFLHI